MSHMNTEIDLTLTTTEELFDKIWDLVEQGFPGIASNLAHQWLDALAEDRGVDEAIVVYDDIIQSVITDYLNSGRIPQEAVESFGRCCWGNRQKCMDGIPAITILPREDDFEDEEDFEEVKTTHTLH